MSCLRWARTARRVPRLTRSSIGASGSGLRLFQAPYASLRRSERHRPQQRRNGTRCGAQPSRILLHEHCPVDGGRGPLAVRQGESAGLVPEALQDLRPARHEREFQQRRARVAVSNLLAALGAARLGAPLIDVPRRAERRERRILQVVAAGAGTGEVRATSDVSRKESVLGVLEVQGFFEALGQRAGRSSRPSPCRANRRPGWDRYCWRSQRSRRARRCIRCLVGSSSRRPGIGVEQALSTGFRTRVLREERQHRQALAQRAAEDQPSSFDTRACSKKAQNPTSPKYQT